MADPLSNLRNKMRWIGSAVCIEGIKLERHIVTGLPGDPPSQRRLLQANSPQITERVRNDFWFLRFGTQATASPSSGTESADDISWARTETRDSPLAGNFPFGSSARMEVRPAADHMVA